MRADMMRGALLKGIRQGQRCSRIPERNRQPKMPPMLLDLLFRTLSSRNALLDRSICPGSCMIIVRIFDESACILMHPVTHPAVVRTIPVSREAFSASTFPG
jgi:hypothetical protein